MELSGGHSVLVVGSIVDPGIPRVQRELLERGCQCTVLHYEEAVLGCTWTADLDQGVARINRPDGHAVSLRNLGAIWFRRWGYPVYPQSFSFEDAQFAYSEITSFVSALSHLSNANWLNSIEAEHAASLKIYQMQVARELGLHTPPTVVTSDAKVAMDFRREHGRVIFKPLSGSAPAKQSRSSRATAVVSANFPSVKICENVEVERLIFTQELTDERIECISSVRWSPTIFQKLVEKEFELRVTIVGNRVFACRIDSQVDQRTSLDFRHMNLVGLVPHQMVQLAPSLEVRLLKMMRRLGLGFGCFDLIAPKGGGDPIFLEVNPSGQWLWIEDTTKVNISAAVAEELCAIAK